MKKCLSLFYVILTGLLILGMAGCGGGDDTDSGQPAAPAIAKVKIWLTLDNNPDATPVVTLTPEQTLQASIWARGTTEDNITFKVNLYYGDTFTTLVENLKTEGRSETIAVGSLVTPLEPGSYIFKAHSGSFGDVVGSLTITVTPPPLSEQPDKVTFDKYFTSMQIAKVPVGAEEPEDIQMNAYFFAPGEQLGLFFTSTQEVLVRHEIYDVQAQKVVSEGGAPRPVEGNFGGWEPLDIPVGKYEYKVYADDVLVAIFPFEVR